MHINAWQSIKEEELILNVAREKRQMILVGGGNYMVDFSTATMKMRNSQSKYLVKIQFLT